MKSDEATIVSSSGHDLAFTARSNDSSSTDRLSSGDKDNFEGTVGPNDDDIDTGDWDEADETKNRTC